MAEDTDDKKPQSRTKKGLTAAGKSMREAGQRMSEEAYSQAASRSNEPSPNTGALRMQSYKKGGRVKRTGLARLHKGEKVMKRKRKRMSGRD